MYDERALGIGYYFQIDLAGQKYFASVSAEFYRIPETRFRIQPYPASVGQL